jgi:hypothetical protein
LKDTNQYITKTELKKRGWTDRAIDIYLSDSDKVVRNKRYVNAPPMHLYLKSRVEGLESCPEYLRYLSQHTTKRIGAQKGVSTKKDRLIKEVQSWAILLKPERAHTITQSALLEYNRYHPDEPASHNNSIAFLNRITVNYLRHKLTNYDEKLNALFGKVGKDEAYQLLNQMIYKKISEQYPELATECKRQLVQKYKRGNNGSR